MCDRIWNDIFNFLIKESAETYIMNNKNNFFFKVNTIVLYYPFKNIYYYHNILNEY